ncbi:hypothetical protein A7L03_19075 [Acinetobacter baumannii]|nr:hypothetical protein A7L03_19075 [Acinetobacter baumannii]
MRSSNVLLLVLCFCLALQLGHSVNLRVDGILSVDVPVPTIEATQIASAGGESRKESRKDGAAVVENHEDHKP